MRILIAEDEKDLQEIIVKRLKKEGYGVDGSDNGEDALYYLENTTYDLAILDIMMPKKDGIEVVKALRAKANAMPILFLTAKDAVHDRVEGLDAGADDYLTKPFSYEELLARVRSLLRRNTSAKTNILSLEDLTMDLSAHVVKRGEKDIKLSAKEFAILEYLLRNQGKTISRAQMETHVWDYDFEGGSNIIDVYMRYLRKKIDADFDKKLIHTVRGVGYRLYGEE